MNFKGHGSRFRTPRPGAPYSFHFQERWPRPPPLLPGSLLLPSNQQPPPMFGPRGATIPPRFYNRNLHTETSQNNNRQTSDDQHWCETCDRGFKTSTMLENHTMQHEKCNIDGCPFVAHPKVITKHIQMQHSSGLYNKISKLNDAEEIKKWREERRKKFPTKANIDKNNAAVKEKIERGEKMGLQKKTFPDYSKDQHKHKMDSRKRNNINRKKPKKVEKACPTTKAKHSLPAFTGINQLLIDNDSEENPTVNDPNIIIEDEIDDLTDQKDKTNDIEKNAVCGAITHLIANYGSSDEDGDSIVNNKNTNKNDPNALKLATAAPKYMFESTKTSIVKNITTIKPKPLNDTSILTVNNIANISDDSGPEEITTLKTKENSSLEGKIEPKHDPIPVKTSKSINKTIGLGKVMKRNQNVTRKLPSTLLEKLLFSEIKHERNITLQCIRYIIKNNYFEK